MGKVIFLFTAIIAFLVLFSGCTEPDVMGLSPFGGRVDADSDGYYASGKNADCNDSNPYVNPGAVENTEALCTDGIDNDCDGKIDGSDKDCKNVHVDEGNEISEPPSPPTCGDGTCESPEDWQNCPGDCQPNSIPHPAVKGRLEIHHIDIGQGDATVLVSPAGKVVLFDSAENYWNSGKNAARISTYIQALTGTRHIDYFINSHLHLDHIGYVGYGGIWKLVNGYGFTVNKSYVRDYNEVLGTSSGTYEKFVNWTTHGGGDVQLNLELVNSTKTPFTIDLGDGARIDVLYVNAKGIIQPGNYSMNTSPPSENDFSMVTVVRYGDFDELIAGDLSGQNSESSFGYHYTDVESTVGPQVGDVEVYRVDHHGSSHSTNPAFLSAIDPEASIISVGNANPYHHPNSTVVDKLKATSDVYMTQYGDRDGINYTGVVVGGDIVVIVTEPSGPAYTVEGKAYGTAGLPVCGNGIVEGFEECDDGNTMGGDGCSSTCTIEGRSKVVISEVAWMGTTANTSDEWIELYNAGNLTQDLTGWSLVSADGAPGINLSGIIPARGYILLERTDDSSVPEVAADLIYTGSLENTFEKLMLKNSTGTVIDETPDGTSWAAGDSPSKATMYRVDSNTSIWATSTVSYSGGYGTPRMANS
jgi:cysteine-rich repeat protein